MKKAVIVFLLLAAVSIYPQQLQPSDNAGQSAAAGDQQKELVINLNDAISIALKNNRDILISDQDLNKAEAQIGEAYGNAFPQIGFSASYQRNVQPPVMFLPANMPGLNPTPNPVSVKFGSDNSYAAGLSISQVLFSAKVNTAIKIAKDYRRFNDHNAKAVEENVVLSVKEVFYGVLLAQEVVNVRRQGLDLARANYENLKQLFNQGMVSEFDLLTAEVLVSNTEPQLSQAENNLKLVKNGLKNLLGLSLEQPIRLEGSLQMETVPEDIIVSESKTAVERNSNVLALEVLDKINEKAVTIQKADYFPTLMLVGSYQYQTQANDFKFGGYEWAKTFVVGLQISYPIFSGLQTKYKTEQAEIDRRKVLLNKVKLEEGIKIQVESARLRMKEASQRVAAQAKSVEQAHKAVNIAEVRFKNGVGTQLELINAQVALTGTQINRITAVFDYLNAKAEWENAAGYNQVQQATK